MSQSTFTALGIFFAFLIFITVRGELPVWMSLILWAPAPDAASGSTSAPLPQTHVVNIWDVANGKATASQLFDGSTLPGPGPGLYLNGPAMDSAALGALGNIAKSAGIN
jgi:hypothetical protein